MNSAQRTWRAIGAVGTALGLLSLMITTPLQWVLGSGADPTAGIAAHPTMWRITSLLGVFGPAVWIAGIVVLTGIVRARGWTLTTLGGIVTALALAAGVGHLGGYFALLGDLAHSGADTSTATALLTADGANLASTALLIVFLVGFTLGPIVLTIGLRRARLVPIWLPVAAVIAGVANFVGGPIAGTVQLIALALTYIPLIIVMLKAPASGPAAAGQHGHDALPQGVDA